MPAIPNPIEYNIHAKAKITGYHFVINCFMFYIFNYIPMCFKIKYLFVKITNSF
jgi:hypothetical protein